MIKRLNIYFKEMYPIIPRYFLSVIIFFEIYFLILLNNNVINFNIGMQEFTGVFTIFSFLMWLRIADDFKDYKTDKILFKDRPLPSGRVKKNDLIVVCFIFTIITFILNFLYMNNFLFFIILYLYGYLMSKWFFKRNKIQTNLLLALLTHNPVQIFINLYIVTFTCIKYNVSLFDFKTILSILTLYFPALIWEVSRKIKKPEDETKYETYSKIFGYKKATIFVLVITIVDIITNIILINKICQFSILILLLLVLWMIEQFIKFIKKPDFELVNKVELYTYLQEITMLVTIIIYILRS